MDKLLHIILDLQTSCLLKNRRPSFTVHLVSYYIELKL